MKGFTLGLTFKQRRKATRKSPILCLYMYQCCHLILCPDVKNSFEVVDRDQPKAVFTCKTEEEKNGWMAALMTIYMKR